MERVGRASLGSLGKSEKANIFALATICAFLLVVLCYYGETLLPPFPDESLFLQPAQNLVEGKGMGTPALDNLLPGIDRRTYWQPPVYFLTLSVWCKFFGFEVISSRWLSRFCAVLVLLLSWLLARRWGVERRLALLCVAWIGLDLTFQYNANLGRMDTLNSLWLLASLLAFTAHQQRGRSWRVLVAGVFAALATLTHFIAIPSVLFLLSVLVWRKQGKAALIFATPIAVGWLLWLGYAAQDWQSWVGQLGLQFARKGEGGLIAVAYHLLFLQSFLPLYGVFPTNAPPIWSALAISSVWALARRHLPKNQWQVAFLAVTFFSSAFGGELWYIGWWTPFGYILLCLLLQTVFREQSKKAWFSALCLLWVCWQLFKIGQAVAYVPQLKRSIDKFFAEVQATVPKGSTLLLHCVPDPFPLLRKTRPDLTMVQISPTPMLPGALLRAHEDADFFVGLTEWGEARGIKLLGAQKEWHIQTLLGSWSVRIHPVAKDLRLKGSD